MTDQTEEKPKRRINPQNRAAGLRIAMAIVAADTNQEHLGFNLGVSQSTISKWVNGKNLPSGLNMTKLAKALKTTPEAILGVGRAQPKDVRNVRIVGNVAAGNWREAIEEQDFDEIQAIGIPAKYDKVNIKAFRVKGDSMNLLFPDGSTVFVAPKNSVPGAPRNGNVVLVMRHEQGLTEATLKEFVVDARGEQWLWPRSRSPEHQVPIEYKKENTEVEITGVVIASFIVNI